MELQVGVKVILRNKQGLYLLIQRSQPLADGSIKWDIPGGRIKPPERLAEALSRELQEEIGGTLEGPIKLIMAQDIMLPDAGLHVVRLTYIAELDASVTLSDEHQDFRWITKADALQLPDIDPYLREPLEML